LRRRKRRRQPSRARPRRGPTLEQLRVVLLKQTWLSVIECVCFLAPALIQLKAVAIL
jgi:hypothetical protein